MAVAAGRGFLVSCRHHPILISAPFAVVALGVGFAAQALLRPASPPSSQGDLLATLIADPTPSLIGPSLPARLQRNQGSTAAASSYPSPTAGIPRPGSIRPGSADPLSLAEPGPGEGVDLEIRVALLRAGGSPELGATGPWRVSDRQGNTLQQGGSGQNVPLASLMAAHAEAWLETGPGSHLLVSGRPYAGRLRLLRSPRGVQLVNHLPLETYVASVVGAEMPSSWEMEALRAQAVAARSYAMAHMARPADPHWHLGDTTRWQAYSGLSSMSERTRQATASTSGVILSYQGGIVESLYASTGEISREAHGHLGASMSQHGAQDLARQGLRYNDILGRFYQGASLARLQAGAG